MRAEILLFSPGCNTSSLSSFAVHVVVAAAGAFTDVTFFLFFRDGFNYYILKLSCHFSIIACTFRRIYIMRKGRIIRPFICLGQAWLLKLRTLIGNVRKRFVSFTIRIK